MSKRPPAHLDCIAVSDSGTRAEEEAQPATPSFGSTVTILFSDIRGFTEYTDVHGDESAYTMLRLHNALVQEQLALYRGHVVKTQGDSFMVSFDSARTAVTCAIAIQKAIREANRQREGARIEIGIGINTGEPVREGADFFGGTVNLASRICAVAEPGQILVSETLRAVAGKIDGTAFEDKGEFALKGFREAQHLYGVVEAPAGAEPVKANPVALAAARPTAKQPAAPKRAAPVAIAASTPSSVLTRRRLIPAVAAVLVILVAAGGAYALSRRGAPGTGTAVTSTSFPHGTLIYQAKAAADAWSASSPPTADPVGSAGVTYSGGVINLNILKPGGNLGGELQAPALKDFALELVISAAAGTDLEINWWLRGTSDSGLDLHIDLPTETMQLYWSPNVGDAKVLAKDIHLTGLQSGKRMAIGVVANGTNISIYLNNARVAQVVEARANGGTTPGFYMDGQAGTLRLESIRYFAVS
jgi:class 3 adenylate cyclase